MTFLPVATLPVNTIFATRGSSTRAAASASSTATTFTTPVGQAGLAAQLADAQARRGSWPGAGFRTTVFPAASAAATPTAR